MRSLQIPQLLAVGSCSSAGEPEVLWGSRTHTVCFCVPDGIAPVSRTALHLEMLGASGKEGTTYEEFGNILCKYFF